MSNKIGAGASYRSGNPMLKNPDGSFSLVAVPAVGTDFVHTEVANGGSPQYASYYDDFLVGPIGFGAFTVGAPSGNSNFITDANDANHPGIFRVSTGTVSGSGQGYWNGNFGPGPGYPNWTLEGLVQTSSLTSGFLFGFLTQQAFPNAAATGLCCFIYDSSIGANWQVTANTHQYDTGVAAQAATWTKLTMVSDGINVYCYINGVLVKTLSISGEGLTASPSRFGVECITRSAVSVNGDLDYISYVRGPVVR